MLEKKAAYLALKRGGVGALGVHVVTRFLGDAHFLRPASSIDFRAHRMESSETIHELLMSLLPSKSPDEVSEALLEAESFLHNQLESSNSSLLFPNRWNSGKGLQTLLYAFVRLQSIELVVETGTANGASTLAISGGLHANRSGRLYSLDIEPATASLVPDFLRDRIEFVRTDGSQDFLVKTLKKLNPKAHNSLFLHDADHSYLGQINDFESAQALGFQYIFSDDIDSSLAFCDFAGTEGKIFFDSPKFIGCYVNGLQ